MKKILTVGIVGLGYWGPNLVRNLRALPDCRVKTVCDVSEDPGTSPPQPRRRRGWPPKSQKGAQPAAKPCVASLDAAKAQGVGGSGGGLEPRG